MQEPLSLLTKVLPIATFIFVLLSSIFIGLFAGADRRRSQIIRPIIDVSEQGDSYIVKAYTREMGWVHYTKSDIGWQFTGAGQ